MKICILIAIALSLLACGGAELTPIEDTPDSTIHMAGNAGVGSYWKNSVRTELSNQGVVNSMVVDGDSVFIGGWTSGGDVVWKNGNQTVVDSDHSGGLTLVAARNNNLFGVWYESTGWVLFKNGTTTPINQTGAPTAMGVLGDEVYLAGSLKGNEYPWNSSSFYYLDTYAQTWRNEQVIFTETVYSNAQSIFIHNNDIYMGGHRNHYPSLDRIACYWKNGERIELTRDDQDAEVRGLFVTDEHVYATGMIDGEAVYWIDGAPTYISNGAASSIANSISVLGTDVYVGGRVDKFPSVWKNGIRQTLPDQEKQGEIKVVVAVAN
ncbi:MAG TPA: hypothetical protein VK508_15510 [Cyclobacteriaceae bacterium]|nr:hypothetical protein [Cyclobacteriaceae bacterium]